MQVLSSMQLQNLLGVNMAAAHLAVNPSVARSRADARRGQLACFLAAGVPNEL